MTDLLGSLTDSLYLYTHGYYIAVAVTLVSIVCTFVFFALIALNSSNKSTTSVSIQTEKEKKEKPEKKKKTKKTYTTENKVEDIEDLLAGSLIPITTKAMKMDGVKPYSLEQKADMLSDLETHLTPNFMSTLSRNKLQLKRTKTEVFQMNIGLYCNQACTHCHVDSSPKRKEMMSRATVDRCLEVIANSPSVRVVDVTGGAPELNREFKYLVAECRKLGMDVIDRCNLTVLLEPKQEDLPQFLADHQVHVIASMPCYQEDNVDKQRGQSVFQRSVKGLQLLNELGYGKGNPELRLDLVYNPTGVHLPPARVPLEVSYKAQLFDNYGIVFDRLICITNIPINRFYEHLKTEKTLDKYMEILHQGFNPSNVPGLMCRSYVSIKWDGHIYDCDFNQQVEMHPKGTESTGGISVYDIEHTDELLDLRIATAKHCYGCTAGAGSS